MPVVINDFEMVPDEPQPAQQAGNASAGEKQKNAEAPEDAGHMLRWLSERHERVRAH